MPRFSIRFLPLVATLVTALGVGFRASAQTATPAPTPVPIIAGSTFVPVSGFFDFVPDTARGLVYFSSGTQILRWRLSDQTWLPPITVGANLCAIDISPDGNTLAVAQARLVSPVGTSNGSPAACVTLVNLNTLGITNVFYPPLSGENGSYSLAYDATGALLISPSIIPGQSGGSAFHVWNPTTNQVSTLYARTSSGTINDFPVASNTAIVADTTRNCLSFVEINTSSGNWGFYTPGSGGTIGALTRFTGVSGTSGGNYPNEYPFGIAPDTGSRFFLPTAGALQVRNSTGGFITRYGGPGTPLAPNNSAAYDSSRSLLYLTPATSSKIEIREPSAFGLRATLNAGMTWPSAPSSTPPYTISHMRAAPGGSLLGVQVSNGVRLYTLEAGLPAGPPVITNALTTPEDTPYSFTFGTDPSATYAIVQPPAHGVLTGTGPAYTYSPAANYNGSDFFAVAINGAGRGVTATITPVNDAPVATPGSTSVHTNESRTINLNATDVDLPQGAFSDPNFTIEIVTQPAHGTLTRTSSQYPIYNYVPATNYAGDDSFTFRAFDGQAYSSPATFSIKNIGPIPVARDDFFSATLDSTVSIPAPGVLSNDTPSNISSLSGALNVSSGSVTLNADGSFVWKAAASGPPSSNFVGFQYRLGDSYSQSQGTVTLRLVPLDAQSQNITLGEDIPTRIHLNASGVTPPTLAISKNPSHGTLSGSVPDVVYTPAANYNGPDSFEFTASDGTHTATGTIALTVNPINDAPTATDSTLTTDEDTPLTLTLPASDVDGDALTYEIVQGPPVGTLVAGATPGVYTYTPPANFSGPVPFNWRANDGALNSRVALTSINVVPVNDAPVAQSQTLVTDEDTNLPVQLVATDVDNSAAGLTFKVTKTPAHGQLLGTAPNLFYRPDTNYYGVDSFEFTANDGSLDSAPATVAITVNPVNDAPTAQSQTVGGDEDTNIDITLGGADIEGDALTFKITRQPDHGTLKQDGSAVFYRAFDDWNGTDSFGFTSNDGTLSSAEATVTVIVRPVSDTPVARADAYSTDEDTPLTIAAPGVLGNDIDVDGKALKAILKSQPANGAVTLNADGSFTYTPDANWNGSDAFTYAASDGTLESASATVALTVNPVNDAPVARPDVLSGKEDQALSIVSSALLANDFDAEGDTLSITSVTNPAHGTLVAQDGGYLYTPDANWNGDDAFSYTLSDGQVSATGTVTLHIAAVNDAPRADAQTLTLDEDSPKAITLSGSDVDGDALTFNITRQPVSGTLSGTAPNLTYTPATNFNGTDSFAFVANDGIADSAPATATIAVSPVNDAPVAAPQSVTLDEDTTKTIVLSGTDVDGDALSYALTAAPTNGTLSGTAPNLTYTPRANFNGSDSFSFSVSDPSGLKSSASVSLTVRPVNDTPTTTPLSISTTAGLAKSFSVAASASDMDGDALAFALKTAPTNGTVSSQGGANFTYTPRVGFSGSDAFAISATDPSGAGATIQVSVAVTAVVTVNHAPVTQGSNFVLLEDGTLTFNLVASDVDGDALIYIIAQNPQTGTLTAKGGASFTFTPPANYFGTQTFTFQVRDARGAISNISTVELKTNPVNDAPSYDLSATALTVAKNSNAFRQSGFARNLNLGGLPYEQGQVLTFTLQTPDTSLFDQQPAISSDGTLSFRPRNGKTGTATITINARDSGGTSDGGKDTAPVKTFTITIR